MYPTLEFQLPCTFPAVTVEAHDLVRRSPSEKLIERFKLICRFCADFSIKGFASIIGFWAHLVHQHQVVDNQERLGEVQRTALLWKTYWDLYSPGGKKGNPTLVKLNQVLQLGFTWHQVLEWSLRYY